MKKLLALLLTLTMIAGLTACGSSNAPSASSAAPAQSEAASEPQAESETPADNGAEEIAPPASPYKYSMASGSVGGNFYLMGGGIAQVINQHLPEYFMFTSETTGGSTANLSMLQSGDAELGISMTASLGESQKGEVEWTAGVKHDKLRGALALYPSWLTIYTLEGSGIETMADLEGKIVGLGSKGMAMDTIFRQFFEDRGITPKQIHNDGHAATATALGNGVIDAAILFSFPPFAAISELESTKNLKFIALNDDEQKYLTDTYDFYKADAMPGGSYKGAPEDVQGVSEWNMLVSSVDVPEEQVYLMVKALCENQADMIAVHHSAEYMTAQNTLNFNIPLHAGTVRYLKEIGIDVPTELVPPEYAE